jgi:prephenate dehydrogenase
MWHDIFQSNADEIAGALADLVRELGAVQHELEADPPKLDAALALLRRARDLRERD